ncbi:hypothetical protein Q7P36_006561 [Cladosporium allicinum]
MGPSLRKRLSKRTSEATEVKSGSSTAANTALPLLAAITHLQPPSTSKEDLNITPPPPDDLMMPRTPEKARESPASLLERYKERTPIAKAPAMPSPSEVLSMARSRIPNFPDNFNENKDLPPTPIYPPSGIPTATAPIKSTIRTVGGVDFQMVNAAQAAADVLQPRSSNTEPAHAAGAESEDDGLLGTRRRLTRSQSKKEERSDSTVGDVSQETLQANIDATLTADDDNGDGDDDNDYKEAQAADSETPPSRKVVKKKPSSNPSTPTKSRPKVSRFTRHLTADRKRKEEETISLAPKSPVLPTADDSNPDNLDNPNSPASSSSSSSSVEFILDSSNIAQVGPASPPGSNFEPLPTIRVIPPSVALIDQVLPGLLWASPLSATSRPALPWTWCKRWTCCRCAAGTIVEQSVCSKLACGHHRCGGRCVVKEGRNGASM